MKLSPTSWNDHPTLGLLTVALGNSIAEANRSGLSGDATVLTIDGCDTSSQAALEIVGSSNANAADQGFIRFYGSGSKNPYATIVAVTPGIDYTSGNLAVRTYNAGVEGTVAPFTNTGRVGIGNTASNANGGILQLSGGITFPATAVAASDPNTLDDYEEGTWTPAIAGTTLAGAGTYSAQVGRYTKIGNTVTAHFNLTWSAHTGTGNMLISGLPFTSANVTNLNPAAVAYANNLTITGISVILVTANAATGTINSVNNGTAAALAIDTAATLITSITYQTA